MTQELCLMLVVHVEGITPNSQEDGQKIVRNVRETNFGIGHMDHRMSMFGLLPHRWECTGGAEGRAQCHVPETPLQMLQLS